MFKGLFATGRRAKRQPSAKRQPQTNSKGRNASQAHKQQRLLAPPVAAAAATLLVPAPLLPTTTAAPRLRLQVELGTGFSPPAQSPRASNIFLQRATTN